jgi:hypothetical protein
MKNMARLPIAGLGVALGLHLVPAMAAQFTFTHLYLDPNEKDFQGKLAGVYDDQAAGWANDINGTATGFVWANGTYTLLPAIPYVEAVSDAGVLAGVQGNTTSYETYNLLTGVSTTMPWGPTGQSTTEVNAINASGAILGTASSYYRNHKYICQPFEQQPDGTFKYLAKSAINGLASLALIDSGAALLSEHCGFSTEIYRDTAGTPKKYVIKGVKYYQVAFYAENGVFGGGYQPISGPYVGFTSKGGPPTTFAVPNAISTSVTGVGPHGEAVGSFSDATGYSHGFVFLKGVYHQIDFPKANNTTITALSATGAIIGYFDHGSPNQGPQTLFFIGTCAGTAACTE